MDCPFEENLIRMKLDGISAIKSLDFDIPNRQLVVFHSGQVESIEKSILELKLGGKRLSTEQTDQIEFTEKTNQKNCFGPSWQLILLSSLSKSPQDLISESMGLVADSLDMLADSFVYGLSLFAVGGTLYRKKRIAKLAGYFQITLAIIGFVEVLRRFFRTEALPHFTTMIVVFGFSH